MTIEASPDRAIAALSPDELRKYKIDIKKMSLSDPSTRILLGDIFRILGHMGMIRSASDRNGASPAERISCSVECLPGRSGGCTLFLSLHHKRRSRMLRFADADAVSRASEAGALDRDTYVIPDGRGYIMPLSDDIEWWRECLLREFSSDNYFE